MGQALRAHLLTGSVITMTLVLSVAVAGCGDASDPPPTRALKTASQTPGSKTAASQTRNNVTKADARTRFIARADAACTKVNAELKARNKKKSGPQPILKTVPGNIVIERKALRRLRALHAPVALAFTWREILALRETAIKELGTLVQAVRDKKSKTITELIFSKKSTHGKLSATAQGAGFKGCAELG